MLHREKRNGKPKKRKEKKRKKNATDSKRVYRKSLPSPSSRGATKMATLESILGLALALLMLLIIFILLLLACKPWRFFSRSSRIRSIKVTFSLLLPPFNLSSPSLSFFSPSSYSALAWVYYCAI